MPTLTPAQFASAGGKVSTQGSNYSAYQNFVQNNVQNAVKTQLPTQSPGLLSSLNSLIQPGGAINNLAAGIGTGLEESPVTSATRVAQAGVAATELPKANQQIAQENESTTKVQDLIDQMNATTDPAQKVALANQAKQLLVSASIPDKSSASIALNNLNNPVNELGVTVQPQQGGVKGAEQAAGNFAEGIGEAAGGDLPGVVGDATGLISKGITGAIGGGVSGGLMTGGSALQNPDATAGSVLGATGKGVVAGGLLGAGGAVLPDVASSTLDNIKESVNKVPEVTTPTPVVEKLSPEQQDLQHNITQSKADLEQAQSQADAAAEERKAVTPQAVQGVKDINTKVSANLKTLGDQFGSDAAQLEKTNPDLKLNLSTEQVNALNALKENKNFVLPDKIQKAQDVQEGLGSKFGNIKIPQDVLDKYNAGQQATQVSLSPTEAQDLIKELNRSTFRQAADGTVAKDYQRIGITNEIKAAASKSFGPEWDNIYSKYSQGRGMIDKIDSIANLDPKATPEDLNNQLQGILKQSKTPEGKLLLQQSINEYQKANGVDLKDPISRIQQIADKQTALDDANSKLSDAQKVANKAQRDADIAKLKQQQKMSTFKGRHPTLMMNANYFTKRAAWGLTGGAIIGALGLSVLLKKGMQGK